MQLLKDEQFRNGFILSGPVSNVRNPFIGDCRFSEIEPPQWKLCQWASHDLITSHTACVKDGKYKVLETGTKCVRVLPGEGKFRMDVKASGEYSHARVEGEDWPHLLIDQNLADRDEDISLCDALTFRLDFRIDECINTMPASEFDSKLHTAQFQWYCTLRNNNKNSPDYGDCIWFGLQFFDARYPKPGGSIRVDDGKDDASGFAIYCVEYDKFMPEPVKIGKEYSVCFDILPEIKRAINKVKEFEEVKSFRHTALSDLRITSMNLGWELPGAFDVKSVFSGLSLEYEKNDGRNA